MTPLAISSAAWPSFQQPWVLWLLTVPLALCLWELLRPARRLALPLDHGEYRVSRFLHPAIMLLNTLPAWLLAAAILILAGPVVSDIPQQRRKLTNIEIALDISGSMTEGFGEGTRYDAAMKSIEHFTSRRRGDAFGLTIFGDEVLRWTPLTKDTSAIRNSTPFVNPEAMPYQFSGTRIGNAVRFCADGLSRRGAGDAMIILVSDGESADLDGNKALRIGRELADRNIVLYAIHIGEGAAPGDLHDLSRPNGGRVFAAENPGSLIAVFEKIDQMRPVEFEVTAPRPVTAYRPILLTAMSLLGIYLAGLFGMRFTPW